MWPRACVRIAADNDGTYIGSFIGGITIPLALILLGANFAQLKMPRPLSRLPIMAMVLTTAVKMVLLPVIGVFLVQAMTNSGFVDRREITLRFVLMFLSGTPTAVKYVALCACVGVDWEADRCGCAVSLLWLRCMPRMARSTTLR